MVYNNKQLLLCTINGVIKRQTKFLIPLQKVKFEQCNYIALPHLYSFGVTIPTNTILFATIIISTLHFVTRNFIKAFIQWNHLSVMPPEPEAHDLTYSILLARYAPTFSLLSYLLADGHAAEVGDEYFV